MSDNNNKPDMLIILVFCIALLGVCAEFIYFNYSVLGRSSSAPFSFGALCNAIYNQRHWNNYGLAWRIAYMIATGMLVYVMKVSRKPDQNKSLYLSCILYGGGAILLCKTIWLLANSTNLVIVGDAVLISGLILFPFGLIGIKTTIEIDITKDLPLLNQVKRKVTNKYSINWKTHHGYVNILNPFRGISITGSAGSGKSYTLIEEIIEQMISKGFTACIYDFKAFTLGTYAYNVVYKNRGKSYEFEVTDPMGKKVKKKIGQPKFYLINFKDVRYSHRCNPLHPSIITNAARVNEAAQAILFNLNKDWIKKGTDFFSSSAIAFLSSIIMFLKKQQEKTGQEVCSLPHAIAFAVQSVEEVVEILVNDEESLYGAAPIKEAVEKGALEQLAGVVSTLQNAIGKLAIKEIFWVMTGNDFSLDLNNPEDPKIICIGNDDQLSRVFAPALSLYLSMISKTINQKGRVPSAFIMDEFPTCYVPGIDQLPNTGRSNLISTVIAMQDHGQLDRDYGKEEARVLKAGLGNIFIGEVIDGETAKYASELLGKQYEEKISYNINPGSTSHTINRSLESVMPVSRIQQLNMGEFVGKVSDLETIDGKVRPDDVKLFNSKFIINKPDYREQIPEVYEFDSESPEKNEEVMKKVLDENFKKIYDDMVELKNSVYWDITIKKWFSTNPSEKFYYDEFTKQGKLDSFIAYIKKNVVLTFDTILAEEPYMTSDKKKKTKVRVIADVYAFEIEQYNNRKNMGGNVHPF